MISTATSNHRKPEPLRAVVAVVAVAAAAAAIVISIGVMMVYSILVCDLGVSLIFELGRFVYQGDSDKRTPLLETT